MARERTRTAQDLVDVIALMPWWLGCALALVSYLLLHAIAGQQGSSSFIPGEVGNVVVQPFWTSLATVGQYLVPVLFLVAAAASAIRRRQRKNLLANAARSKSADALKGISWQEFAILVGEAFRLQGYQVSETGRAGAYGGVDLVLRKGTEKFFVQCKQWKAFTVSVKIVRDLYGVMAANGAAGGFMVTSGSFTEEARAFASGRNIQLMDGQALVTHIKQAQATRQVGSSQPTLPTVARPKAVVQPLCPLCSKPMVRRAAKQGPAAGGAFWGCVDFPVCRGTRQNVL